MRFLFFGCCLIAFPGTLGETVATCEQPVRPQEQQTPGSLWPRPISPLKGRTLAACLLAAALTINR